MTQQDCYPDEIKPAESHECVFDINHLGDKKLKVFVSEALNEGIDAKPSDNVLNVDAEVVRKILNLLLTRVNFYGTYNTADNITLSKECTNCGFSTQLYMVARRCEVSGLQEEQYLFLQVN